MAIHIPWDKVNDYAGLAADAAERGLRIGGINSNTFQDEDYKLGSICHPDSRVRAKAMAAIVECCEIARAMNAQAVKVWLGDGTNYPGQDDLRGRHRRLVEGLREAYGHLPAGVRLYLEYKLYEPALYSTDVQDWGQSLNVVRQLGDRAGVCVDTGHHAMGVNIEQIVALLLAEGRLAAFDLNDKKYGDDDLMVGSIDPYQLFRIAHELVNAMRDDADPVAQRCANETVYMLDQCHNIEPKVPAMIRSVMNLQETFAKALLVDREALLAAQAAGDVLEANRACRTRSRPTSGRCSPSCASRAAWRRTRTEPTSTPARPRSGSRPAPAAPRRAGPEPRERRPAPPAPEVSNMALQEPFPGPDEILASIGEGGKRLATSEAAEAFDVRTTTCERPPAP